MAEIGSSVSLVPKLCLGALPSRLPSSCLPVWFPSSRLGTLSIPALKLVDRSHRIRYVVDNLGRVAESADARDLKSRGLNRSCGFKSRLGH